jgi:hypothetical protein
MKKILIFMFLYTLTLSCAFANTYIEKVVLWYKFRVIKYDTKDPNFIFKIWVNPNYWATDLRTLMEKNNWISAINWAYFCPADYRECGWKDFTDNERYIQWYKIWINSTTGHRVVFAIDEKNSPFLFQTNNINSWREEQIYYWISNFPLLLRDWESKYEDYVNLGLIDSKMKTPMSRNFVCSDYTNNYIFSWYVSNITMEKLPEILLEFGCWNAINLDAWASNAMIYNWKYIIWPGRNILDGIIIERKWLDVKAINDAANVAMGILKKRVEWKSYDEKVKYMNEIWNILENYKQTIYDKLSLDTYDKDWKKDGYKITIKNVNDLTIVYLLNYLIKLSDNAKKEFLEEEKLKQEEESKKSWLF